MLKVVRNSPAINQNTFSCIQHLSRRLCSGQAEQKIDNYPGVDRRPRFAFTLDEQVEKDIKADKYKPRKHPGARRVGTSCVPEHITKAVEYVLQDYNVVEILKGAESMSAKIWAREGPMEQHDLNEKVKTIKSKVLAEERRKMADSNMSEDKQIKLAENRNKVIDGRIKNEIYNHQPFDYTTMEPCLSYMLGRSPGDYASLLKIFNQIKQIKPHFKPETMLDFGSGVGSATWAVDRTWPQACKEVVNVDSSPEMNKLNEIIQKGGDLDKGKYSRRPNRTFFRQFLAVSGSIKYDLVVASRTMFEMTSRSVRLRSIDILYKSLNPGGVLVIAEAGNLTGCGLVQECREFLTRGLDAPSTVVAPCRHSRACPLEKKTEAYRLCYDKTKYEEIHSHDVRIDSFAYIAVTKEEGKGEEEGVEGGTPEQWPRLVQPIMSKSGYTICRVCTAEGELRELGVCKKKHGTIANQVARHSELGDLLPVNLLPKEELDTSMSHASFLEEQHRKKHEKNDS